MTRIGTIAELWRYPVKSMRGERLTHATFDAHGLAGDRRFAFESTTAPPGKPLLSSHERTAMLAYTAALPRKPSAPSASPLITTPDNLTLAIDSPDLLHYAHTHLPLPASTAATFTIRHSPERPLTDVRPLSLASSATLAQLSAELGYWVDPQRFRSNLILTFDHPSFAAPFAEDQLAGRTLQLGETPEAPILAITERIPRCRIVSLNPATTEADPSLLRHLAQHHGGRLGLYATVRSPGTLSVSIGTAVHLL